MTVFLSTDRLHLLLALVSALTGTWWGIGTGLVVLTVLAARVAARRRLASGPTGRLVLADTEHPDVLDPSGDARQPVAAPNGLGMQAG
jgi:hypothetical protein